MTASKQFNRMCTSIFGQYCMLLINVLYESVRNYPLDEYKLDIRLRFN